MNDGVSRRGLFAGAAATAASTVLGMPQRTPAAGSRPVLRVAFMADVHLDTTDKCIRGFKNCLKLIHALPDKPDLIVQGGDIIYDALVRDEGSVERQYDLAKELLAKHCTIPIVHVIGNHDVWGWMNPNSAGITADPKYGKSWWLAWTGYGSTYRSFDKNGWHFILLDSIMQDRRTGYAARLDKTQMQWLSQDLAETPRNTPICLISHVPILSMAATFFGPAERTGNWHVSRALMHIDARDLKNLLNKYPNVKTCLSGHIHMADRIDYNGVKYFGIGAVSGAWWKGKMQETPPQFAVVDFYANGNLHVTPIRC